MPLGWSWGNLSRNSRQRRAASALRDAGLTRVAAGHHLRRLDGAPASIDAASRRNWACVQASGVAENVGSPGREAGGRARRRAEVPDLLGHQVALVVGRAAPSCRVALRRVPVDEGLLAALAAEQRPAASERLAATPGRPAPTGCRRAARRTRRSWRGARTAVGRGVGELAVDHLRVLRTRVVGRLDAEADQLEEAGVDDPALVDQRSAVGDLQLVPCRGCRRGDPQVVRRR